MTSFDYGVLVILGASVLIGVLRGLIKEGLSLVAYVAAFTCAMRFGPAVYEGLEPYVQAPILRLAIAYLGVFIAVLLAVGLVNLVLSTLIKATGLGVADRGLGGVFGLVRGVLVLLVLVIVAGFTPLPKEPWWTEAKFSPLAEEGARQVKARLPERFADWVRY